jgi:hypothetical protein
VVRPLVPRGLELGCHVAPCRWLIWYMQELLSPQESNRRPFLQGYAFTKDHLPMRQGCDLLHPTHFIVNKVHLFRVGQKGVGAKPQPVGLFDYVTTL